MVALPCRRDPVPQGMNDRYRMPRNAFLATPSTMSRFQQTTYHLRLIIIGLTTALMNDIVFSPPQKANKCHFCVA